MHGQSNGDQVQKPKEATMATPNSEKLVTQNHEINDEEGTNGRKRLREMVPRNSYMEVNISEDKMREIIDREITSQIKRDKWKAYREKGLPPDPSTWTCQQAALWFHWLSECCSLDNHFSRHIINHGITGPMLCFMNEQQLHEIFCTQGDNVDILYQHLQFWKTVEPLKIEEMIHSVAREREMVRKDFAPKLHIEEPIFHHPHHEEQQQQHHQQQQQQQQQQQLLQQQRYQTVPRQTLQYSPQPVSRYIAIPMHKTTAKRAVEEEPKALDLSTHSSRQRTDHLGCLDLSLKKTKESDPSNELDRLESRGERSQTRENARAEVKADDMNALPSSVAESKGEIKMAGEVKEVKLEDNDCRARLAAVALNSNNSLNKIDGNIQERASVLTLNSYRVDDYRNKAPVVLLNSQSASTKMADHTPKVKIETHQYDDRQAPLHINFYNTDERKVQVKTETGEMMCEGVAPAIPNSGSEPKDGILPPIPDAPAIQLSKATVLSRPERPMLVKRKRGRPPKPKPPGFEKRKKVHPILWRFLLEGLNDPAMSDALVWVKKEEGLFRFVSENKDRFARMWGERKGNKSLMTYSKMARALRHYGKKGIFQEFRRRLHYKFNPNYIQKYFLKQKNGESKR